MSRRNREKSGRTPSKPRPREEPSPARPRRGGAGRLPSSWNITFRLPGFLAPAIGESRWFAPALTAAYALVLAFTLFHHELWRDELQHWMLPRDSAGPLDLFRNMKYETIPKLWHLLLLPVTRLTSSPVGMQILHWVIASAAIFVVARYAPFNPLQKILFTFGYFPLYEYGVMSRNYALGLLFAVVACALLRHRYRKPLWLALALALMSNSSAHACIVAIGVLLALVFDYWLNRRALAEDDAVDVRKLYAGFAVAVVGILLAVLQMIPPADVTLSSPSATWHHAWYLEWNPSWLAFCLKTIPFVVFFPVDPSFVPVVGTTAAALEASLLWSVWTAVALLAAALAFHGRRMVAVLLFLCLTVGLLAFFYAVHFGSFRHHGFLLVALLVSVWGGSFLGAAPAARETRRSSAMKRVGSLVLTVFLAMQAFGGLKAVAIEVERPFSLAERTAEYIQANGLESLPMIGFPDWPAIAVLGHLSPEKRIHYVQGNREGSFVIWDGARIGTGPQGTIDDSTLFAQTQALAARNDGKVLMILTVEMQIPPEERRLRLLASFTGAIASDENFYLYLYATPADGERVQPGSGAE